MYTEQEPENIVDVMYLQAKDSNGTEVEMKIFLDPSYLKPPQFSTEVRSYTFLFSSKNMRYTIFTQLY